MDQGQSEAAAKGGGEGKSWSGEKNRRLHQPNEGERKWDIQNHTNVKGRGGTLDQIIMKECNILLKMQLRPMTVSQMFLSQNSCCKIVVQYFFMVCV
jgi:hypothetical protein